MRMNEIMIFSNPEFGSVRTVTIDGVPWFVGIDVATALGYQNGRKCMIELYYIRIYSGMSWKN